MDPHMQRFLTLAGAVCAGVILALSYPYASPQIQKLLGLLDLESKAEPTSDSAHGHDHSAPNSESKAEPTSEADHGHNKSEGGHAEEEHESEGKIKIAPERIKKSGISVRKVGSGTLSRYLSVPAVIVPDRNRVGRVPAKVVGTVSDLKKGLGDPVAKGEVVAVLESREVADAKSEYIAALVNFDLQETLYERQKTLWEKKVTAEQNLLRARAAQLEARVRRDLARQKLLALGVHEREIEGLSTKSEGATALERYDIRAPIGGRVVEQLVDIGTPVGGEGQAKELYAIADLSTVWAELTVSTADLSQIKEGQKVTISVSGSDQRTQGAIIFTSPMLDQDTRSARVIASVDNQNGAWRPGSFVTADVAVGETRAKLAVPNTSLHKIKGETIVFVRTPDGFEAREVTLGEDDGQSVEITSGLEAGDEIATANTFLLKADIGKSEAGHSH